MMTRRIFLKNGSLALVSLGFAPVFIARTAQAAEARKKMLVAIFQRGAVDGLNMIVPFGDPSYYKARPTIAIPKPGQRIGNEDGAVDLDGFFGLHPRMAPLAPLFKEGELAIVHACGSHDPTRSHFDAQDYMESGTPGVKSTRDGWLNRVPAQQGTRTGEPVPRGRACAAAAAHAPGHGARARDRPAQPVRRAGRPRRRHGRFRIRSAVRAGGRHRSSRRRARKRSTP